MSPSARRPATAGPAADAAPGQGALTDAMVVAGGAGRRLWPLTDGVPKPLVRLAGQPLLSGMLARFAAIGVARVHLVVGADPAPFRILDDEARALGIELRIVPEPQPLDTAGGVRAALPEVDGTFLVCNGDILTDLDLAEVVAAHRAHGAVGSLVLTRVEDPSSFGVCVLEGTDIVDFVEKPPPGTLPGQDTVNAGTYVLEPEALAGFAPGPLSFERTVFPQLLRQGQRLVGLVRDAAWADLGTPDRLRAAHRSLLRGQVSWPSVTAIDADPDGRRISPAADVDPTARIEGPVSIGPQVRIGPDSRIGPDVVVAAGTHIGAGVHLVDTALGADVAVADGVRARGLLTGDQVRIGAAVVCEHDVVLGPTVTVPPGAHVPSGTRLVADAPVSRPRPSASR